MSDTRSPIAWNSLVDDLANAKHGKIYDIQPRITEFTLETINQVSKHSNTSQRHATAVERVVRTLDDQRCFVTNKSGDIEVARLIDNSNAGNGHLASSSLPLDALRGLGVVHHDFNLDDISNRLLMSPNLHFLWNKYAAFVIVPSTDTRKRMIEILINDRKRLRLALENKQAVEPHQLANPELVTYDIILFRPSLLGSEGSHFQRADNYGVDPTCYRIPTPSKVLHTRLEYLTRQDDEVHISEFLSISHVTGRSSQEVINPYLMVINALPKLEHWCAWGVGVLRLSVPDSVFMTAFKDCHDIAVLISSRMYGAIHMVRVVRDSQACRREQEEEEKTPSTSSRDLSEEPESPVGSGHPHHDPSTQPGTRSWISLDKGDSLENWREEVGKFSASFQISDP